MTVMSRILYMKSNLGNLTQIKKWEPIVTFRRDSTLTAFSFDKTLKAFGLTFEKTYEKTKEFKFLSKRFNTLNRCFSHPLILEKRDIDVTNINCAIMTITTSPNTIDYGNNEKFKPILLYVDSNTGQAFYTARILVTANLEKLKLEDLTRDFSIKDTTVRNLIVKNSLLDLQLNTYKILDLEKDFFSYIKGFKNIHKPDILQTNTDIYIIKKLDEE